MIKITHKHLIVNNIEKVVRILDIMYLRKLFLLLGLISFGCLGYGQVKDTMVTIGGVKIHVQISGKAGAPFVLVLHGGFQEIAEMKLQIKALEPRYRVIAMDSRGHGRSSFVDSTLSYELFARDAIQLLDKFKIKKAHVVGWSDGGITGLYLSFLYPNRIHSLTAIGVNTRPDTTALQPRIIANFRNWNNIKVAQKCSLLYPKHPTPKLFLAFAKRMGAMYQKYPDIADSQLQKITCAVLFIFGEHDIVLPDHPTELNRKVLHSRLEVIPQATHYCPQTHPSVVNKLMMAFLESIPK